QQQQQQKSEEIAVTNEVTINDDGHQHYDLESIVNSLYDDIIEQLCLGIYFDFYKSYKLNSIRIREYSNPNDDM
ncbi:hypothetical protein BLA29_011064, partial [Euroglyphus maynei]